MTDTTDLRELQSYKLQDWMPIVGIDIRKNRLGTNRYLSRASVVGPFYITYHHFAVPMGFAMPAYLLLEKML